jgi:DUF4097 and DUF4098 domain-containing protein YvlB
VGEGGTLYLELDYGNIEIVVGSDDMVHIVMERTIRVDDEDEAREILRRFHDYTFDQHGDDVIIESRYDQRNSRSWGNWGNKNRFKVTFRVTVPERYNVDFETGAGNISVADLGGEINGRTGAGNIDLGDVDGIVEITSGAGNISVERATNRVEVNTGAGTVDLKDVMGFVRANTGAGNITARISSQPESDSRLESGAGNVTVFLSDRVGVYVDAVASMGSASSDYPLKIEGKWMKKSFEGEVNGGGPDLFMRAGVGNVTLRRR